MSDDISARRRVRRRTNTAPEPIVGDLERERWRAEMAAVRMPTYRLPRGGMAADVEPDAMVMELESSGAELAPGLAARIAAMGPRITSQLLELVEREARIGGGPPSWGALHALAMLGHLRDGATLPRLLDLLRHATESWLASKLTTALRSFGRTLVDPAIAAYRSTDDPNHRALLLEVLTGSRVTDPRIRDLCCEWLANEPAFGADMLVDYGDPIAIKDLRSRLSSPESGSLADEHVVALYAAFELLGGTMTIPDQERMERAMKSLCGQPGAVP